MVLFVISSAGRQSGNSIAIKEGLTELSERDKQTQRKRLFQEAAG